ncbi:MAG: hypothetical protein ACMXYM_01275 [Candidatus Woesearchaeota archaeon]
MKAALILIGLLVLTGCSSEPEHYTIAACRTMAALIGPVSSDTITIETVESSAHAFTDVREGRAHAALTGRPPIEGESFGYRTRTVRKGSTLLAEDSRVELVEDLSELDVAICIDDYPEGVIRPLPCESYPDETTHRIVDWESWKGEPFVRVIDGEHHSLLFRGVYLTGFEGLDELEAFITTRLEEHT